MFSQARYIGQLFGTYIALEQNGALVLVDQHAAHERALYEKLKKMYEDGTAQRQMLLEAVTVNLLPDEMLFVQESKEFFARAGFAFEEFGHDAVVLREAPIYSERLDIKEFFLEVLEAARRAAAPSNAASQAPPGEALYDIACRAAVKGNKPLSPYEASALLRELDSLPKPLTCPHGRPLAVAIDKRELDKKFRRV